MHSKSNFDESFGKASSFIKPETAVVTTVVFSRRGLAD